jgi:hypothetical protein
VSPRFEGTCAASSRKWTASTPASAGISSKKTTVAIDGAIREGREIFFIPKLEGDNPRSARLPNA